MSIRVVYDCMMFFMQAARPGRVRETFQLVENGTVVYCPSPEILAEIQHVLTRPRHLAKFPKLTSAHIAAFLDDITRRSFFVETVPNLYVLERDPKDSKYINLAVAAGANYIVTRDDDLLDLMNDTVTRQEFRRRFPLLRIVNPAAFVSVVPT